MNYKDIKIKNVKKKNKSYGKVIIFLVLLIGLFAGGVVFAIKKGAFDPISIISTVSAADLKQTDGRTNILLLGLDKRKNTDETSESLLTDTLLFISIGLVERDVVMISLPRDLWVEDPRGAMSKINEVYVKNLYDDSDDISGSDAITQVIENVLGLPIHYYATVNFELFKTAIDTLGGVEVNVERSFTDYKYPVEGKENAPRAERYETVEFEQGLQTMNGETALKYVRSRQGTNGEGTDFARAERQQKVIAAIKNKVLSIETILNPIKIKGLFDSYRNDVDTNITFDDIQNFYVLSQQIDFDQITSVVLDDRSAADEGGLLYAPTDSELYGGAYVLIPKVGDFSQIHAYAQRYMFSEKR